MFDDKSVDAVVVATPNHWHALATIWACQAGKDVYVEKPFSHNIWEGRQMVAAARKYGRIVQAGTQAGPVPPCGKRSTGFSAESSAPSALRGSSSTGNARASARSPSPRRSLPVWITTCGAARPPRNRCGANNCTTTGTGVWSTGTGEMGNNGVHYIDVCRWAMRLDAPAPRVMSVGGRFGFDDDGETPNTQVAILDYQPAPIYCEIRGLPEKKGSTAMDSFLNTKVGVVIQCEGGYFAGAHLSGAAFDHQGKEIKKFGPIPWGDMDTGHMANFVEAVRSRKAAALNAEILEGHLSAACCHQVNISHRLGRTAAPGVVLERTKRESRAVGRRRALSRASARERN